MSVGESVNKQMDIIGLEKYNGNSLNSIFLNKKHLE